MDNNSHSIETQEQSQSVTVDDGLTLENHRLSQNFEQLAGVKKAIITVPVKKITWHHTTAIVVNGQYKTSFIVIGLYVL